MRAEAGDEVGFAGEDAGQDAGAATMLAEVPGDVGDEGLVLIAADGFETDQVGEVLGCGHAGSVNLWSGLGTCGIYLVLRGAANPVRQYAHQSINDEGAQGDGDGHYECGDA